MLCCPIEERQHREFMHLQLKSGWAKDEHQRTALLNDELLTEELYR